MNIQKVVTYSVLVIAVVAAGMFISLSKTAKAADQSSQKCEVYARSYSVGADTVTANFEVKNTVDNTACTKDVTLAAWDAPNGVNGVPFDQQKFVDSKSGTFAVGFSSLTVKKPKCFYQVDLLRGLSPYGAGGTSNNYDSGQYVSSAHGGTECKPTPAPTPTPVTPLPTGGPSLPQTGVESGVAGILGMTGLSYGAYALRKSKKAVSIALRNVK